MRPPTRRPRRVLATNIFLILLVMGVYFWVISRFIPAEVNTREEKSESEQPQTSVKQRTSKPVETQDTSEGSEELEVEQTPVPTTRRVKKKRNVWKKAKNITKLYEREAGEVGAEDDSTFFADSEEFWEDRKDLRKLLLSYSIFHEKTGLNTAATLTVKPVGQLCNRLMTIISGFFLSLLTKKRLVVEDTGFYASFTDLFKNPDFDWLGKNPQRPYSTAGHTIRNPPHPPWPETERLLCSNLSKAYSADVQLNMNQYIIPYMEWNPYYKKAVSDIFKGDVFGPLARYLFRPTDHMARLRDEFVSKNFKGKTVIGLQVRSGGDFTSNAMTAKDWDLYKTCGDASLDIANDEEVVYFIATDTEESRKEALKHVGRNGEKVIFGPGPFLRSNNPKGVQMALLDVLLLAEADSLVTTAWSSFGYMAAGLRAAPHRVITDVNPSGDRPVPASQEQFYMGVPHKSDKRMACKLLPTHQPCFHKFANWGVRESSCYAPEMVEQEMLNGRYC